MEDESLALATYETPVTLRQVKALEWSTERYLVCELVATSGMSDAKISETTGIPITAIKRWKKHPDFIQEVRNIIQKEISDMRTFRLGLCMRMINSRVDKIDEMGGDFSMLSTKDTLDIMSEMRKDSEVKDDVEQSQYMKTIEALISKTQPVILQLSEAKQHGQ